MLETSQIEEYQRNGAVCIRSLLSEKEINLLREGIEKNLRQPSPLFKVASDSEDPSSFVEDFCNWQNIEEYRRFIFESSLSTVASLLMQSKTTRLYHDHLLVKEPGTKQRTPWHQDQPYYNIEGRQNCSMWIPVDPVPKESTLEFLAGSHLGPWLMPRSFRDKQAKWFPEGSLGELPDIENDRAQFPIIGWDVNPGDVVCFHMLTLHASGGVGPQNRRRVFSVRFIGDDIVHAPRPWTTSPPFLNLGIPEGASMDHQLFPVLTHLPR